MTGVATFAVPPSFLGIARNDPAAPICIAGIPFDLGTTNRAGARFGPAAIRQASRMLIDGDHPVHWVNPAALPLADIGNFAIVLGDIAKSLALIEEQAARIAHLVALGGDHGITLPLLRALAKKRGPVALVHFDAHVDTWPDNFGQTQAHGTVFYHAIKEGLVKPHQMVQIGIRSPLERAVHDWTLAQGITVVPAQKVHEQGPAATAEQIRVIVGDGPALDLVEVTHDDGRPRRMQPARGRRTEPPGTPGNQCDGTVDDHADLLGVWTADGPRGRAIQTQPF